MRLDALANWDSEVSFTAYVGLGSNLGDRAANLQRALDRLSSTQGIHLSRTVAPIETKPVGPSNEKYLNTAAELQTDLTPRALLQACLNVEKKVGRTRSPEHRWEARSIDIDILLYGSDIVEEDGLIIPHPQMHSRFFVLEPMNRLAPDARHPRFDQTVAELLAALEGE